MNFNNDHFEVKIPNKIICNSTSSTSIARTEVLSDASYAKIHQCMVRRKLAFAFLQVGKTVIEIISLTCE